MLGNDRVVPYSYFSLVFILQFIYVVCTNIKNSGITFYGNALRRLNQYEQLILAVHFNL